MSLSEDLPRRSGLHVEHGKVIPRGYWQNVEDGTTFYGKPVKVQLGNPIRYYLETGEEVIQIDAETVRQERQRRRQRGSDNKPL